MVEVRKLKDVELIVGSLSSGWTDDNLIEYDIVTNIPSIL